MVKRTQRGRGYLTDEQFFNPQALPPVALAAAPTTAASAAATRPVLLAQGGGGFQTSQQYFNPHMLPPGTMLVAPSSAPTSADVRPILVSTGVPQMGGRRRGTRRSRGGFVPSIMGSFTSNAQAAIVPAALYLVYHTMVPKNMGSKVGGLMKRFTRRFARKNK
jgi:hypothetical protein